MKKFIAVLVAALVLGGLVSVASAHTGFARRLQIEDSDTGSAQWQKPRSDSPLETGSAANNNARLKLDVVAQDGDDYVAVYANGTGLGGRLVGTVRNVSFDFLPGAPAEPGTGVRYSIPIDEDGNGSLDGFLFAAARDCADPIGASNWFRADFTGRTAAGCTLNYDGEFFASDGVDSAWDLFAAAHPTYKTTTQATQLAFVILDEQGSIFVDRLAFHNHMFVAPGSNTTAIKHCASENTC